MDISSQYGAQNWQVSIVTSPRISIWSSLTTSICKFPTKSFVINSFKRFKLVFSLCAASNIEH